eukprot:789367-Amphidinium_carterae.1
MMTTLQVWWSKLTMSRRFRLDWSPTVSDSAGVSLQHVSTIKPQSAEGGKNFHVDLVSVFFSHPTSAMRRSNTYLEFGGISSDSAHICKVKRRRLLRTSRAKKVALQWNAQASKSQNPCVFTLRNMKRNRKVILTNYTVTGIVATAGVMFGKLRCPFLKS